MIVENFAFLSHRQDAFSGAYIRAICATAGCTISIPEPDIDKIDYTIGSRVAGTLFSKPKIDIQAKCLLGTPAEGDSVAFALDIATYDNLRDLTVVNPRILVVVVVPTAIEHWLQQTETHLGLHHCAYWLSLKGSPATENVATKTVHLPRTQVFSTDAIQAMMHRAANGEDI